MSVYCEHHESADCLTLVDGELEVRDGEIAYAKLEYVCERYELVGTLELWGRVPEITGALVLVESRGTPLDEQRGIDQ